MKDDNEQKENRKETEADNENENKKGRKMNMLSVKELVRGKAESNVKKISPVEEALKRFHDENGYDFLEMINNERIRKKHHLRQLQKKDYDDNDFLELFQDKQGE
jgi:hypothetical protein